MENILRIFGKPTCPHTIRALNAHPTALFVDVLENKKSMDEMLELTDGNRRIPVIVDVDGTVTIGHNGGS